MLNRLFDEYNLIRSSVANGTASQSTGAASINGQGSQDFGGDDDKMDLDVDLGYGRMDCI